MCVCVLTNFTVHRHAQLNSAAAQFWAQEALTPPLMEDGGGRRGEQSGWLLPLLSGRMAIFKFIQRD